MRLSSALVLAATLAFEAHANPGLHGIWSAAIDGQPLIVTFDANGGGKINGAPMQWQTLNRLLLVQQPSGQVVTYTFHFEGKDLVVAGGDLKGKATFSRGYAAADAVSAKRRAAKSAAATQAAQGGPAVSAGGQELVGKWCKMSSFAANTGGSSRSTCFELRADGTYAYQSEGSMSGTTGSTASQSGDTGRWKVSGNQLTAQSRGGAVNTYTVEKRNHPKNKRDPMICLDGECYVTFFNKPPW